MEERLKQMVGQLGAAVADLERSFVIDTASLDPIVADAVRSGQAQKFEFTVELFWKAAKVFLLEDHGLDLASPKTVVKKYFELGYLEYPDCDRLLHALDIRNSLSHIYRKETFLDLHKEIMGYSGFFGNASTGMSEEKG
jgi:nucleotidyltransferase substrate binding protein (TIGR01987 family)